MTFLRRTLSEPCFSNSGWAPIQENPVEEWVLVDQEPVKDEWTLIDLPTDQPRSQSATPTATSTARKVANAVRFPARYIGSKSWSFPGRLLSIPFNAYNWISKKPTPSSSYHNEMTDICTPKSLKPYLRYAAVNAATHTMDDGKWLEGFDEDTLRFREVSSLGINVEGLQIHDDKAFFDLETGLKATVAASDEEVVIAFGALDSLADVVWAREGGARLLERIAAEGETEELKAERRRIMDKQASAAACQKKVVAANLLGGNPPVYEQAAELVAQLKEKFPGKKITLTGQCFGGSIATYTALRTQTSARCFNTLALGAGCQYALGDAILGQADDLIEHVSAKTDWISDNRKLKPFDTLLTYVLGIRTPGNFGKRFSIQSAYESGSNIFRSIPLARAASATHDYMLGSILFNLMPDWRE